ncbi:MAG: M13 family metallopeptidase [Deltaproteobacteria bacterium]|nr:M13 family metallopeptidase [Deltaproteobacteria bacterium]
MAPNRLLLLAVAALFGCGPSSTAKVETPPTTGPRVIEVTLADVGLSAAAMDRDANPCEDFYQFACGGWLRDTKIPADRSRWSRSFSEINKRNEAELKAILDRAAVGTDPALAKLGHFYGACMDEPALEDRALPTLGGLLTQIREVRLKEEPDSAPRPNRPNGLTLAELLAELHRRRLWALFDIDSGQSSKDATQMIAHIDQNGLGLPDRDYYLKPGKEADEIRAFYGNHLQRMFVLSGYEAQAASDAAAAVMVFETALATVSKTRVERRDPEGTHNKIDRVGLVKNAPAFDWVAYLAALGLERVEDINVTSVPYIEGLDLLLAGVRRETLVHYLTWHVLHRLAPALSKAFVDEDFKLTQVLTGQAELRPRWKRCIEASDAALGELLAQPFVAARFTADSKAAVTMMVTAIGEAFVRNVDDLSWMDESTRQRAREKQAKMAFLIGYPDQWKTYDFEVDPKEHVGNVLRSRAQETSRELGKIGKPVDRGHWYMTPPTVNAYYDEHRNQMVFPAGILQPPFYSPSANLAVNLGAMGMVVAHELTHGFDDKGSQFDGDGNLRSWWSPEVRGRFEAKTQCVADEYGAFEVLPGVTLDGQLTLGENIADMGGVKLALAALRALRAGAEEVTLADGFTEDQQLLLSFGQVWCAKFLDDEVRMRVRVDSHSHPRWRVNGSVRNLSEFAEVFSCPAGSAMSPAERCQVW